MELELDETHEVTKRSFVPSANDGRTEFPIQNLPLGVFSRAGGVPSLGVAIGDQIFDLGAASRLGLLPAEIPPEAFAGTSLNTLFALGRGPLRSLRRRMSELLDGGPSSDATRANSSALLVPMADASLHRPTAIGDFSDFYAGIHHARSVGALWNPEDPLPQNYKWLPLAYHGRASSVQIGRGVVRRPTGQLGPNRGGQPPSFGPSACLDFELEIGFYIGGGNGPGEAIDISVADDWIAGYSLLNDWSARDLQRWEMFPLGPFLGKSFATSVSPWVVTADALAPFRIPAMARPELDPGLLDYLHDERDQRGGGLDIALRVFLTTPSMRGDREPPVQIAASNARHLFWTPAQMVAHHTVNGCGLTSGDLIGTGTISGPTPGESGSLLELTRNGDHPLRLPNGEQRVFLLDGDEVTLLGRCQREGYVSIGFGACSGIIAPAKPESRLASSSPDVRCVRA